MPSKYRRLMRPWHNTDVFQSSLSMSEMQVLSLCVNAGEQSLSQVCLGCALSSLSWSSIWILWQRVFIVTCSFTPRVSLEPEGTEHFDLTLLSVSQVPAQRAPKLQGSLEKLRSFRLPDTVPENSGSYLVIRLSVRFGRGPTRFHLQQLALRSRSLPELWQTAGLAFSTKCASGTAPCLISCSALKKVRAYWASLHNWLYHRSWGQHSCCDSMFCLDSYLRSWLHCSAPGNLHGNGWSAFAQF